jgi:hypothetical protein
MTNDKLSLPELPPAGEKVSVELIELAQTILRRVLQRHTVGMVQRGIDAFLESCTQLTLLKIRIEKRRKNDINPPD